MNRITLPPGFHLYPGRCPDCGRCLAKVDELEGLPIWGCPARSGREIERDESPAGEGELDGDT